MSRNRPNHIVQLQGLQQFDAAQAQRAAQRPDDDRPIMLDNVGSGGNRHQTRNGAVEDGHQIDPAEDGPRQKQGGHDPCRGGQIGVGQHIAHGHRIGHAT